tara:strand:+ start:336 stop:521 length:186 start_codon:yes stop_codon:yes gene_type:complete
MSKSEDILYKAHHEGIKDEVFEESKKMKAQDPAWHHVEYCDCLEEAYRRVKERKNKKNENI